MGDIVKPVMKCSKCRGWQCNCCIGMSDTMWAELKPVAPYPGPTQFTGEDLVKLTWTNTQPVWSGIAGWPGTNAGWYGRVDRSFYPPLPVLLYEIYMTCAVVPTFYPDYYQTGGSPRWALKIASPVQLVTETYYHYRKLCGTKPFVVEFTDASSQIIASFPGNPSYGRSLFIDVRITEFKP